MNALRAVQDEPIPGYRLLEPLGRGGFGEVWKCEAPGGFIKAIKFVKGEENNLVSSCNGAAQELRALQFLKTIRHPFLLSIERVEVVDHDLVIVMELADKSLHDLLQENRKAGNDGLPRKELLGYLREAAEVLDLMNQEHGLKHLDIKPHNLFLVGKHIKVADFGLVNSLAELYGNASKEMLAALSPLYAAPETFSGQVTLFSDQYSLAVTYHELLTGEVPIKAKSLRQLALLIATTIPDLSRLAQADRPVVARALSREPRERFQSCTEFIEALAAAEPAVSGVHSTALSRTTSFELPPPEMVSTTVVGNRAEENGSGLYRRRSRIVPAVRPAPAGDGPLPGYQLEECLGRGPTGEVWRGRGPRLESVQVRFLTAPDPARFPPGEEPMNRLLCLRHRSIPAVEQIALAEQRIALVTRIGDCNLLTRFKDCQSAGMSGIPRRELLGYLARAADALDELYHLYQLQHLALTPRHLVVSGGEVTIVDFGLAELLWLPENLQLAMINPRYAAIELFEGLISDGCDQYSLALMYQELLVGLHPLRHLNGRQIGSAKYRGQPDVSMLPALDRPIVLQALSAEPDKRYRSCRELVLALEEVTQKIEQGTTVQSHSRPTPTEPRSPAAAPSRGALPRPPAAAPSRVALPRPPAAAPSRVVLPPLTALPPKQPSDHYRRDQNWRTAIEEHVAVAKRFQEIHLVGPLYYRLTPGVCIEQRCLARLAPGLARLKMVGFREQWQAEPITRGETRFVMEVRTSGSMLQRCLGRVPGVIVDVCIGSPRENAGNLTPVRINIQPSASGRGDAEQLLAAMAPRLLTSLQTHLSTQAERAAQERFPFTQNVEVHSPANGQKINATLRDIGRDGLCFVARAPLTAGAVTLTLNRLGSTVPVQIPALVRDCFPSADGQYEVEVSFGG